MAQNNQLSKLLSQFIDSLSGPGNGKDTRGTDAPGTNSRGDVDSPGHPASIKPDSGKGMPDALGYHQHGDRPDPERARTVMAAVKQRMPGLAYGDRLWPAAPEYNTYYDVFRSDDGYDKIISNTAHGSWVVGTTTSQSVVLDNPANLRTSQYPGAVMVHPVLLLFTFSQSVTTATGQYSIAWIPAGGDFQFPLGEYYAGTPYAYNSQRWIIPTVITDPLVSSLGTIIITTTGVVGTPTILWRMGIGWAYDVPSVAFKGARPLHAGEWQQNGARGRQDTGPNDRGE